MLTEFIPEGKVRQLDYKSNWYGRVLIQVDRYFPSLQRCHCYGHVLPKLPLEIRECDCLNCQSHNLGDFLSDNTNAALNLLAVERTVLRW